MLQQRKPVSAYSFSLFTCFSTVAFMVMGVVNYELVAHEVVGGLNIALVYGMGLILFAVVLGIIYNFLCSRYASLSYL